MTFFTFVEKQDLNQLFFKTKDGIKEYLHHANLEPYEYMIIESKSILYNGFNIDSIEEMIKRKMFND